MSLDVALGAEREVDESLFAPHPSRQRSEQAAEILRSDREPIGALAGELDGAIGDRVSRERGVHLRPGRLHLDEAELRELLHRPVDLRGRHAAFPADRRGIGNAENHQRRQRFSLVEGEADFFEELEVCIICGRRGPQMSHTSRGRSIGMASEIPPGAAEL